MLIVRKSTIVLMALLLSVSVFALSDAAFAQEAGAPESRAAEYQAGAGTDAEEKSLMPWKQAWQSGGIPVQVLMYVLVAMSFLAVTLVVYFFVVLRAEQVVPRKTLHELLDKLRNGNVEEARLSCAYRPSPLSAVALSAIDYVRNMGSADPGLLKDVIQGEGTRQAESIQGQTQYLLDIAVISPMVGLLGTVFGMLSAFSAVALDIAQAKPVVLANGVAQALITTASGLIVGIPAMMFYAFFRRKASKLVSRLETASAEIMMVLASTHDTGE